jgi:ribonuclease HI
MQPLPSDRPHKLTPEIFNSLFKQPPISASIADNNRRFYPPREDMRPSDLFSIQWNVCTVPGRRFIRTNNRQQVLMFIDGACSNNGTPSARAGCGIVYTSIHDSQGISHALEVDGVPHTSNRAELRAAILALGMRVWCGEGFNSVILACDSEYVVKGACEWLHKWVNNGWKTSGGTAVKNRDLWEELLKAMRKLERLGVLVQFWLIPRECNEADGYAKTAANVSILSLSFSTSIGHPLC